MNPLLAGQSTGKNYLALLILAVMSFSAVAKSQFDISGLVDDQTVSRFGHLFYEELVKGWDIPDGATITLREIPDAIVGNVVWIEVNDEIVFRDKVGTRTEGIEEKAQLARSALESYLQQNRDALKDLGGY